MYSGGFFSVLGDRIFEVYHPLAKKKEGKNPSSCVIKSAGIN